jgi:hypothetical protein
MMLMLIADADVDSDDVRKVGLVLVVQESKGKDEGRQEKAFL